MDDDATRYNITSTWILKIVGGPDKGKIFHLYLSRKYTIGRSEDCDITIDSTDKRASRRHTLLTVEKDRFTLENLSQTNPTIIDGKRVDKISLKKSVQFQVGSTVFEIEGQGDKVRVPAKDRLKLLAIAAGVILVLAVTLMIFARKPAPPENNRSPAASESTADLKEQDHKKRPVFMTSERKPVTSDKADSKKFIKITTGNREKLNGHFRKGTFFYEAGRLKRAISEWDHALALDPTHIHAKIWLLRAEDELETLISKHYQSALISKKYMRYDKAKNEFIIVIELSKSKDDERYLNSVKQLKELEGN